MEHLVYGKEPTVAIFADDGQSQGRLRRWIEAAGARAVDCGSIVEAEAVLGRSSVDAALLDTKGGAGHDLERLFHQLNGLAQAQGPRSVVLMTPELVDIAAAHLTHPDITLLCEASDLEGVAALALALAPTPTLMFEERGDDLSMQLRRVREEVGRIARALATVAGNEDRVVPAPPRPILEEPIPAIAEEPGTALLRQLIRARRLRERFFEAEMFADPAWDMLLDLMLARMEGRAVAVSSLCIAAAVPPTTALRWIKRLTDEGLFVRTADPLDGRRVFIDLSEPAAISMMRYLRLNLSGAA